MSRKSRKKRETKLQSKRDRRHAAVRLGGKRQRAVRYQEATRDDFGDFRCPECKRKAEKENHDTECTNMQEEVEWAQLVDAREKRQMIHEGTRDVIADKPKRLTRGPAATRKIATDMVQSLKNDDLTMYGVRQIMDEARYSSMSERDFDRVKAAACQRWREIDAEHAMERRRVYKQGRSRKWFRIRKKL